MSDFYLKDSGEWVPVTKEEYEQLIKDNERLGEEACLYKNEVEYLKQTIRYAVEYIPGDITTAAGIQVLMEALKKK